MTSRSKQPFFHPKLLTTLRGYTAAQFREDALAGVIVGFVALPLAIAFGIASGVTPGQGLVTAVVAGFLISALGGSRVQIGGPTGAFVVILYAIGQKYGPGALPVCALMAGVMLIGMGLLGMGSVIRFIPYPLTVGFTSGIAVIIFSGQVKDLLGLQTGPLPGDFVGNWKIYLESLHTADPVAIGLSAVCLAILMSWPKISRRAPGPIVALVAVTAAVWAFEIPVTTIGSRFGALPSGFAWPTWPALAPGALRELIGPAFTVAMLGAIESLLSATVADGMIEGRHRSNTELIAQGAANIACGLFGGIPATGAIARTATNVKNGGRTPVAGIVHALTLLIIVLVFGSLARLIPLCVLAAILVIVSYHMSEWHSFLALLKAPRADVAVLVVTFMLTVFVDLTVAVEVGMLLSLILFMKRMTDVTSVRDVTLAMDETLDEESLREKSDALARLHVPPGVAVYEAEGAFFFGVAESLRDTMSFGATPPKVTILRMRHVLTLDASGLRALTDLQRACARMGGHLLLAGIHAQPLVAMERAGMLDTFGHENVFKSIDAALKRAKALVSPS